MNLLTRCCKTQLLRESLLLLKHQKEYFHSLGSTFHFLDINPVHSRNIFTSINYYAKKKKERKPIVYSPKAKMPKKTVVAIWKNMTVNELANALSKTVDDVYELFLYIDGSEPYYKSSSVIDDLKVIREAVKLSGMNCVIQSPMKIKELVEENRDATRRPPPEEKDLRPRPPVVTIMGHVDHGKTTLLDYLRHSSIVDTEFGGITQHIGAFEVFLPSGEQVTFLDTPGHAAFSAMRSRGAMVTDLIVLVVAADDGVLQQTQEVISLAKEAKVPLIVAINKIDKPGANIENCKTMLLNAGVQLEEQGGEIQCIEISALKGINISLLIEALVTQAEVLDLKGDPFGFVEAVVIESRMDLGRGKLATCIVQRGTLRKGAFLVAGRSMAKVRNIFDCSGKPIEKAVPGTPALVIGWRELPAPGDVILEVESERRAKEIIEWRKKEIEAEKTKEAMEVIQQKIETHLKVYKEELNRKRSLGIRFKMHRGRPPLEKLYKDDLTPRVCLVLKGDVEGSVEAILDVLETYHSEECPLEVMSYGVGMITPTDIEMAKAFNGSVYAFNVTVPKDILALAHKYQVSIFEFNIIYRLIEKLQDEISKKLPPKPVEEVVGEATVLEEFLVNEGKLKLPVAGCRCVKGQLKKDLKFKVIRIQEVVHEGVLESMRHHKKEVTTIKKDVECGLLFEDKEFRFQPGDTIICFKITMEEQRTDWEPAGF